MHQEPEASSPTAFALRDNVLMRRLTAYELRIGRTYALPAWKVYMLDSRVVVYMTLLRAYAALLAWVSTKARPRTILSEVPKS